MTALGETRVWRALLLAGAMSVVVGCGSNDYENKPRPAESVDLTGVISDSAVSVSPSKIGAGPVRITILNETNDVHTVTLEGPSVEERVGPVNPQDTATIQKNLPSGSYEVRAGSAKAVETEIPPADLRVGPERESSNNTLLGP